MPNSDFVAIKSKASLAVSPQALFEVLTPGDIEIVRQVGRDSALYRHLLVTASLICARAHAYVAGAKSQRCSGMRLFSVIFKDFFARYVDEELTYRA